MLIELPLEMPCKPLDHPSIASTKNPILQNRIPLLDTCHHPYRNLPISFCLFFPICMSLEWKSQKSNTGLSGIYSHWNGFFVLSAGVLFWTSAIQKRPLPSSGHQDHQPDEVRCRVGKIGNHSAGLRVPQYPLIFCIPGFSYPQVP